MVRWLWVLQVAACLGLVAGCGGVGGSDSGAPPDASPSGLTAAVLADASVMGHLFGANLVRWPDLGDRVVAYLIYRDSDSYNPIWVVGSHVTSYIDSTNSLSQYGGVSETIDFSVEIDTGSGQVTSMQMTPTFNSTPAPGGGQLQVSDGSITCTAERMPLSVGQTCTYRVRTVYIAYEQSGLTDPLGHPQQYRLGVSQPSPATASVTVVQPPMLASPGNGQSPSNGNFTAQSLATTAEFRLQLSPNSTFPAASTFSIPAHLVSGQTVQGYQDLNGLYALPALQNGGTVYWRIGARIPAQPVPVTSTGSSQPGWVCSEIRSFTLQAPPGTP
ncbi:MAG: hypothetical protein ACYDBB_21970 [Armatimonadota bacterium]